MGNRDVLGDFEQAILLAIIRLGPNAYGVSIKDTLADHFGRNATFGAIYTTLDRLRAKGFVSAHLGEATPERGGRAKKFYRIEAPGERALANARERAATLWAGSVAGATT